MKTVPLTFDVDHTHAGKRIARGMRHPGIPETDAQWLIDHRIAHRTPFATARILEPETTGEQDHDSHS